MSLPLSAIQKLHTTRKAIPDKVYKSTEGKLYIGTKEGRIKLIERAEDILLNNIEDTKITNTQKALEILFTKYVPTGTVLM